MNKVKVALGDRSYDVMIGPGVIDSIGTSGEFDACTKIGLIADSKVDSLHGDTVAAACERFSPVERLTFPEGEPSKSMHEATRLAERLADLRFGRNDVIVSLGGGVAGDLAGFVAAVYMRGVSIVHVPTTLLAQVDSSVGGKTGVDLPQGKNLIGAFHQPKAVYSDPNVLSTLSDAELRSGMAEVIKYALCFDLSLIETLSSNVAGIQARDAKLLAEIVKRSVEIKAGVVSADETDKGERAFLNYGHTLGHALEASGGYRSYLHGEAVSIGMVFAAELSCAMGLLSQDEVQRHYELLELYGLPVHTDSKFSDLEGYLSSDKKRSGAGNRWVLLEKLGSPTLVDDVPGDVVAKAFDRVNATEKNR